jgi:hypothetical protein
MIKKKIPPIIHKSFIEYLEVSLMMLMIRAMTTGRNQTGECFIVKKIIARVIFRYWPV